MRSPAARPWSTSTTIAATTRIDTENPGKIVQTLTDGTALPDGNSGNWEGLLVSDGYQSQLPSYGQDISIASPQALDLSGPVIMAPVAVSPVILARIDGGQAGADRGATSVAIAPQQQQLAGQQLTDTFTVRNVGEYQAHYQAVGVEVDAPDGSAGVDDVAAAAGDNVLAPGETLPVTLDIDPFGDGPGVYAVRAGYHSVPAMDTVSSEWLTLFFPAATVTVA